MMNSMHLLHRLTFLVGSLLLGQSLQAQNYTVTDLGVFPTSPSYGYSSAAAISPSGSVVGATLATPATDHATLFSGTGSGNTDLGAYLFGTSSYTTGINAAGSIVGYANKLGQNRATLYTQTGLIDLGTLTPDNSGRSYAYAINASGTIVGTAESASALERATLFSSNGSGNINLGGLPGGSYSQANAINTAGTIVGYASTPVGIPHATLFRRDGSGNLDLGTLAGPTGTSNATAINDLGTIVGNASTISGVIHAVRFSGNGSPNLDLGTLGGGESYATGINNEGLIVGTSNGRAFLYRNGVMLDLNSLIPAGSVTELREAVAINNAGQIAATGRNNASQDRAFRLDPIAPTPPPAPLTYLITATARPRSKGQVTGGGNYPAGTAIVLVAKPNKGKIFLNWKEGKKIVSKKKRYPLTVGTAPRTLVASFL
jgi:probable HAF family extracellular repeat protein